MNQHSEETYLQAEQEIRNNNYAEAFRLLNEVLSEDPTAAPAHNSMGWLYKTQFDDYERAENHYLAAIRYDQHYPHAYWNLCYLYTDLERFDDVYELLKKCERIPSLDKSMVAYRKGVMEENRSNITGAIDLYRQAITQTLSDDRIEELKKQIERCEYKLSVDPTLGKKEGLKRFF